MVTTTVTCRLLSGFGDASVSAEQWERLLKQGSTNVVFNTREYLSAWWEAFGRGQLLLICAERDGEPVAFAPLFAEAGMIYFVGSGGSDYLDFVGDLSDPAIIDELLMEARKHVPEFAGFLFYHVPDSSATPAILAGAARRLGLAIFDEGGMPSPALVVTDARELEARANKKSLVRHERYFSRMGELKVTHAIRADEILGHLDDFFAQHRERWAPTPFPSLFCDPAHVRFYELLTKSASDAGWLRFTRIESQGTPVAFHYGFSYSGTFMWYKPSFAIELARHSPGEVLLRQLLFLAQKENVGTFDFGLGDEEFKSRFATRVNHVRNWGLYDPAAIEKKSTMSN
jgi:CelD/BcsL family acetyltransferase involved in cellulose biosynthesis